MIKNKKKKILSRKKKVVLKKKKVAGPKVNKLNKRKPSINIAYLGLGSNKRC